MANAAAGASATSPRVSPGWERVLLASALVAGLFVMLAVSGTAILLRAAARNPGRVAPLVAMGSVAAVVALLPLGRRGRGPVAAVALVVVTWISVSVQPPLPDPKATIALWMSGQVAMLVLGFWVVMRRGGMRA